MKPINLQEVLKLEEVLGCFNLKSDCENFISHISIDSRKVTSNCMFVAMKGERHDSHDYIEPLCRNSQVGLIVAENYKEKILILSKIYPEIIFIDVKNSKKFLRQIARLISEDFQNGGGVLFAISGSNGKTTTKEMISFLLTELGYHVIKTEKNNNNDIGVPLTLFQIEENTEFAIVELGSNHPGEIKTLCDIIQPRFGFTTNIGETHLEFFDCKEHVFIEEAYLSYAIAQNQERTKIFFVNNDDEYLKRIKGDHCIDLQSKHHKIVTSNSEGKIQFANDTLKVENQFLIGDYNFYNLTSSCLIVHYLTKVDLKKIVSLAKEFKSSMKRSEWVVFKESRVFLDAYNANPSSMKLAINAFYKLKESAPEKDYSLIVGDMNELGSKSHDFHYELGQFVGKMNFEKVVFVGRFRLDFEKGYFLSGKKDNLISYHTTESAINDRNRFTLGHKNKIFMIKASRSLQLEQLIDIT
jgi:UDP-N-acetylmuramoyl-tripeptide--D-alanyl-D-alanine ligase